MPITALRPPSQPSEPAVDPRAARLVLPVVVDGRRVTAIVSGEALQGRFGASADPRSWLAAYRLNAGQVNRAAIRKTRAGAVEPVLLTPADF